MLLLTSPFPPLLFLLCPQKAKKKPLRQVSVEEVGVAVEARLQVLSVEEPAQREAGSKVADVEELVSRLKEAGCV